MWNCARGKSITQLHPKPAWRRTRFRTPSNRPPYPYSAIITGGSKHCGILWIPADTVHSSCMSTKHSHRFFAFRMPDVHLVICRADNKHLIRFKFIHKWTPKKLVTAGTYLTLFLKPGPGLRIALVFARSLWKPGHSVVTCAHTAVFKPVSKDLRYCKYLLTVAPVDGTASRPSQQVTHSQNLRAELIKKTLLNSTSTTFKITTKNFVFSRLNVTSPNQMHGMTIEGNCSSNGVTRSYNSCRITHTHALTKRWP